jgi:hypothetical protein
MLLHEIMSGGQPAPTLIFAENDRLTLVIRTSWRAAAPRAFQSHPMESSHPDPADK